MIEEYKTPRKELSGIIENRTNVLSPRHALQLGICTLVGAALAFVLAAILPSEWQAKGIVQVAQLSTISENGPTVATFESPAHTVDRMKLPSFQNATLKQLGLPVEEGINSHADLIRHSFGVRILRNSNFVELSVRGYTPTDATRTLQQYILNITRAHDKLSKPTLDRLRNDLGQVETDLNEALALQTKLLKKDTEIVPSNIASKFSENVLLESVRSTNANEIRQLQARRNALQEQLNPERTFNTRLMGDIEVGREPVFPKRSLFFSLGAMLGLLLGLAWVRWKTPRQESLR